MATLRRADFGRLRDRAREEHTCGDLSVERLRGRDAHLDVAAIAGVHDTVGFVGQVAVATVDDPDDTCTTSPHEIYGAVRVGGGPALADRDHQRVAHVETHPETTELRCRQRIDVDLPI